MIRVALADDHKLFAKGVEGLLEEQEDIMVIKTFPNGKELVGFTCTQKIDEVLTDLNMSIMDGFGVLEQLKKNYPDIKVLVISMYDDEKTFKRVVKEGADAFILKDTDPNELIFTIHEVFKGRYLQDFKRVKKQAAQGIYFDAFRSKYNISRREAEIIRLIKDGIPNKGMTEILSLSKQRIESH
jgi:DNA-binding NarL/FixJ family response regulator